MKYKSIQFLIIIAALAAFLLFNFDTFCAASSKKYAIDLKKILDPLSDPKLKKDDPLLKGYFDFFRKVYETMDREYYLPVSKEIYELFLDNYFDNVLSKLKNRETIIPEIKYLGSGLLVSKLKEPSDIFSNFYPPKEAEEYKSTALGYELGVGLRGHLIDKGYIIDYVELRSDSYDKGIRKNDIIVKINNKSVFELSDEELKNSLFPPIDSYIDLEIYFSKTQSLSSVQVKVIEFFKETLSSVPTGIPGMFYIKINQFNQKTGEDIKKVMISFMLQGIETLIIDLRGNGGGPPLAAREIAGLFLPPDQTLFYFQRKNRAKVVLKTPPSELKYNGKIAILIDKGSGSASELFAGTLQDRKRAILIGEQSAGKTFLKSMFKFDDRSMLVLTTSLAYLYNGKTFNSEGLNPDFTVRDEEIDLFRFLAHCIDSYYEN